MPRKPPPISLLLRRLETAYGRRPWRTWRRPLDILVGTILSQNTNDRNSDAAMDRLRQALPTWDAVADAPLWQIAGAIRPAGLHRQKADHIRTILRGIREASELRQRRSNSAAEPAALTFEPAALTFEPAAGAAGDARCGSLPLLPQRARTQRARTRRARTATQPCPDLHLDFLRRWPTARVWKYLTALRGVGPKTASCVLLFSLRRPVLPVDTHIHRVSGRLGLIGPRTTAEKAHELLAAMVPPDKVYAFHVLMIAHGRQTCHARRPNHAACILRDVCPSAHKRF
jgi:endonuclease-3